MSPSSIVFQLSIDKFFYFSESSVLWYNFAMMEGKQNGTKIRVGILRGGTGENYTYSLRQGGDVISHIFENLSNKYKPIDILIDKDGVWHFGGMPSKPSDLVHKVDVVWNTSNSSLAITLNNFSIPNVGTGFFSETLGNNRDMLWEHMKGIGVNMPKHIILPLYQKDFDGEREKYAIKKAKEIFEKFGAPWVVKSFTPDSNMGVHVAKTFPQLAEAIEDAVKHEKSILVEELIPGKNTSVHSVAGFRGEDVYNLTPIEKSFSPSEKEKLSILARNLYEHFGATHYLKSDFVINPTRGIYLTGICFSPDLEKDSNFCKSCESVGAKVHHVIEHMLERAL